MRLTAILLTALCMQVTARTTGQTVTLNLKEVPVQRVFKEVSRQTGLSIVYAESLFKDMKPVTIKVKDAPVQKVMEKCLTGLPFRYVLTGNGIVIRPAPSPVTPGVEIKEEEKLPPPPITVRGRILNEKNEPVAGASIQIVGTSTGTTADLQGMFSIQVDAGQKIEISSVGYQPQVINIRAGMNTTLEIILQAAKNDLGEVVVTALGIARDKKTLGYAVQEISGDELSGARDNNIINNISGKIAGAFVTGGGSAVGSSARIVIRGNASFSGNSPLFVVDGIPIDNSTTNLAGSGGIDWGNAAADIDPNNIASVTVLKGANAAALYGSRATNGVILITTKKGTKSNRLGVNYNSSVTLNIPGYWPNWQNEYGGGNNGSEYLYNKYLADHPGVSLTYNEYAKQFSYNYVDGKGGGVNDNNPASWGPRMDIGLKLDQYSTGPNSPWISRPDNYKEFYKTGFTTNNNVSLSAGDEKSSVRFSYTNQNTKGIIYNTDQTQNTLNTSFAIHPSDKLSLTGNLNYLVKKSDNIPKEGYTGFALDFQWTQRDFDMNRAWSDFRDKGNVSMFPNLDNFFYVYNQTNSLDRERGFGVVSATYKITDWLSAMARAGVDFYRERRKSITSSGTVSNMKKKMGGQFNQNDIFTKEQNLDFILNFDKTFGDIRVDGLAGANYRDNIYNSTYVAASDLTVPDLYTISNVKGTPASTMFDSHKRTNSVFAAANASYKDFIFLGVTGRNDWSSTLPSNNWSYFYPSVSFGLDITRAFSLQSNVLTYAKLRSSWAKVGGDTDPYQLSNTYAATSFNGIAVFAPGLTFPPADLKPQETKSYEIGADLRFLRNRFSLDVTYYDQTTVNQILTVASSSTTGYTGLKLNAGEIENSGVEVMLDSKILENPNGLSWNLTLNWAKNKNMVNSLYGGLTSYQISGGQGGFKTVGTPGQPWGLLWGLPYVRDPKTNKIIVTNSGVPASTNVPTSLGVVTPDWVGGITNSFQYKNFNLRFLVDLRKGGKYWSVSVKQSWATGSAMKTVENNVRENGIIVDGVKQDGTPNDVRISAQDYFNGAWIWNNMEYQIVDGSYAKLRELVLGYTFNVKRTKWLQGLNLSVYGRNLAILYRSKMAKEYGLDPEIAMGGGEGSLGFENHQLPPTRDLGVKLSVSF